MLFLLSRAALVVYGSRKFQTLQRQALQKNFEKSGSLPHSVGKYQLRRRKVTADRYCLRENDCEKMFAAKNLADAPFGCAALRVKPAEISSVMMVEQE